MAVPYSKPYWVAIVRTPDFDVGVAEPGYVPRFGMRLNTPPPELATASRRRHLQRRQRTDAVEAVCCPLFARERFGEVDTIELVADFRAQTAANRDRAGVGERNAGTRQRERRFGSVDAVLPVVCKIAIARDRYESVVCARWNTDEGEPARNAADDRLDLR